MKKADRNGENSSSSRKTKSFDLQLSENDVASSVMGGIVEKGFSKPMSRPQVTVLPFPVARHRSHGPHWAPRTSSLSTRGNDDEDDGDEEDHTDFDLVAAGANPIKRKQKKGLDFKQWQELMNGDNAAVSHNKKEHKIDGSAKPVDPKKESGNTKSEVVKKHEQKIANVSIDGIQSKFENGNGSAINTKEMPENVMMDMEGLNMPTSRITSNSRSIDSGIEKGSTSLASEIDAENRALLEKMSTDEIAEAQSEIINKMNPALIKILQKRGQEKMKKKTSFSSAISSIGEAVDLQDEKELISPSQLSESDNSQNMVLSNPKHTKTGLESKDVPEIKSSTSSLWDAWSTNVEAARDLRFSLDGDVINDYGQLPGNGDVSAPSIYSGENASERDFLRTEGDPGAFGYTIKESLALTRSVVPGQRALALHLLACVLYKAQDNICQNQTGSTLKTANQSNLVDWEALWAFALGPEPELALSLRICLDDNHNSVVIACARVIQCVLSYDYNELFFDISEKIGIYEKDVCTAPIFRSRPKIDVGFLHGGFWKYNAKPSNILPFDKPMGDDEEAEGEHTIKDDVVVATQDIAAGLVRMGILPRIRYLLESDPSATLEECLISILVAIARHSPTCADAIIKCERLVQVIVHRFTTKDQMGFDSSKIKSVILMKVLARSERKRCMEFVNNGIFQKLTWHLYRYTFSLDRWLSNIETDKFKLSSALLVEQLRFWKVCLQYGYCVSYFSDLFPALYIWLDIPTFEKLIEKNILSEFIAITKEAYLVLEALTKALPNFYLINLTTEGSMNDTETWCWNHVGPMIDLALKWISLESDPYLSSLFSPSKGTKDAELASMLWVISAVMHMLFGVLKRVIPEDNSSILGGNLPFLPEFVPKIGLHIIKNGLLSFSQVNKTRNENGTNHIGSFLEILCQYRHLNDQETSLASICCLNGIVEVVVSVNKLIQLANTKINIPSTEHQNLASADRILTDGILKGSLSELTALLTTFMKLTTSSGQLMQSVEMFGRGGPAPGVGVGWGTSGGGFWSSNILLAQMDARLVLQLLEVFLVEFGKENPTIEEINITMERVNCGLDLCLLVGPQDRIIMDKVLEMLLQPSVLKCLDFGIRRSLDLNLTKGLNLKTFGWQYKEEDYLMFSDILTSHFKNRWLHVKKKKSEASVKTKKSKFSLESIQEDVDTSIQELQSTCLVTEWAYQRLPLPHHWFLSPITTVVEPNFPQVARCGLFFLLGLESMSSIQSVPVIWKLHALSVTLFAGMDILQEDKSRDVYSNLQEFYGQLLDKKLLEMGRNNSVDYLKFDKEIHDSYSTFVETLVENFAGASYGDLLYGRQISVYLHPCVGAPIRLAAWNALSNVKALELLPPLENCLSSEEGYLEPRETDEMILEAYVKSWVSGALDRSVTRQSVAFTLAVHHLSCFFFGNNAGDRISLRNKLAKSILRDYSRKPEHEGMMIRLIEYKKAATSQQVAEAEASETANKFTVLREACDRNSSLLSVVEKLKNAVTKQQ